MATRHVPAKQPESTSRERFLRAALTVLQERGVAGLTVRGLAEAAGASSIGIYTRFGGRNGVLDALYERTFELLDAAVAALPLPTVDGIADVLTLTGAYRHFALDNPARYAFMFERPVPDFAPDPALRAVAMRISFDPLVARVARLSRPGLDPVQPAYLIWCTMHGLISAELTLTSRSPLPDALLRDGVVEYPSIFREGILSMMRGLGLRDGMPEQHGGPGS